MAVRRDEEAELREICLGLAVQAGAKDAAHIVDLAETLKRYIETGQKPANSVRPLRSGTTARQGP